MKSVWAQTATVLPPGAQRYQGLESLIGIVRIFVGVKKREKAPRALRHERDGCTEKSATANHHRHDVAEVRAGDEHDDQGGRADQRGGPKVHLGEDEQHQHAAAGEGCKQAAHEFFRLHFIAGQTPGQRDHARELRKLGRLKFQTKTDPPFCPEMAVPDVGDKAQDEQNDRDTVPEFPGFFQKAVVELRCHSAENHADPEPFDLPHEQEHRVALGFRRVGRRARHHDETEDDQSEDGSDEDVSASAMGVQGRAVTLSFSEWSGSGLPGFSWDRKSCSA